MYQVVVVALWAMLPAYLPNSAAVLGGGGKPIDGGRRLGQRRILGDGKTWRGTAVGTAAGAVLALALNLAQPTVAGMSSVDVPRFPPAAVLSLPFGAMLGDIVASFLKRRTGKERGAAFPLVDQLDFVVVALLLTFAGSPDWFLTHFTPPVLFVVVLTTPLIHVFSNVTAYVLDLKSEPW